MDKSKQTPGDRKGHDRRGRRGPAPGREHEHAPRWRPSDDVVSDASSRHPVDTDLDFDRGGYSAPIPRPPRRG